jgi:hypothetical protein
MQVIADATNLDILTLAINYANPATREQCALFGANAYLYCEQVVYNANTHSYQPAYNTTNPWSTISVAGSLADEQFVYGDGWYTDCLGYDYYNWYRNGVQVTFTAIHLTTK